jgi:predicted short-subunit dehydrogenase-like oxidoreductase (DUF2520 family)
LNDISKAAAAPRVALVGAGRLARAILRTMPDEVVAVAARSTKAREALRDIAAGIPVVAGLADVDPSSYDIVWIVTADAAIPGVAAELAGTRASWRGVHAIHSSGALPPAVLDPIAERGGAAFALHPTDSFSGEEPIARGLLWSISTRDPAARAVAERLLAPVAPRFVVVEDAMRALYHAAASVASNYSVTLFAIAVDLYRRAGLSESDARGVARHFLEGSAARAAELGPVDALTGPIARGDAGVLLRQLEAVARNAPEYLDAFTSLARATADLLARGSRAAEGPQSADSGAGASSATPDAQSGQEPAG